MVTDRIRENQELLAIQNKLREASNIVSRLERERTDIEGRIRVLAQEEADIRARLIGPSKISPSQRQVLGRAAPPLARSDTP